MVLVSSVFLECPPALTRAALTILQRFSDRLAHYLIHRAFHGLNGGIGDAQLSASSPASSSGLLADAHSIQFAFDEPLWSALGRLRVQATGERSRCLPIVLADRWLQDFSLGLRLRNADAVLPPSLHSPQSKVALCTLVVSILEELLDLACTCFSDSYASVSSKINLRNLWIAMETDDEMRALCAFLPVDWRIDTRGIEAPRQFAAASQPEDAEHHTTRILETPFSAHAASQFELDRSSWYHDSAAVIAAARMQARGELIEAPISQQLRETHVRPTRFWGVNNVVPLVLRSAWEAAGFSSARPVPPPVDLTPPRFSLQLHPPPTPRTPVYACVSFVVSDANGRDSTFLLCGAPDDPSTQMRFVVDPRAADPFQPLPAQLTLAEFQPRQANATTEEVERAFRAATPLLKFSLFGPSLFSENHPAPMRRLFTAHLIDACMDAAGLIPLPIVLSELISEYNACELPFIEDKAREQMSTLPLRPVAESSYDGQLTSAVERACNAELDVNIMFPVPR